MSKDEKKRAEGRAYVEDHIKRGTTRLAAEIATSYGLEDEYPDLIRQYDEEQEMLNGAKKAVDKLAVEFPGTSKPQ